MIDKTISHYKILEKLGEGGMGEVYLAEDTKLKRQVALKFLSSKLVSGQVEKSRFMREAQAAAALNHPNIATIFEIDEHEGGMFIAMEHIEGQNLKQLVESGPLKLKDVINIASQIADGLHAAHAINIVHRDI
jgi:serine/threonine protein kinase